jgi:hypothetical protein
LAIDYQNAELVLSQLEGDCASDNPAADDDYVVGFHLFTRVA